MEESRQGWREEYVCSSLPSGLGRDRVVEARNSLNSKRRRAVFGEKKNNIASVWSPLQSRAACAAASSREFGLRSYNQTDTHEPFSRLRFAYFLAVIYVWSDAIFRNRKFSSLFATTPRRDVTITNDAFFECGGAIDYCRAGSSDAWPAGVGIRRSRRKLSRARSFLEFRVKS